jgi:hypothetical protein
MHHVLRLYQELPATRQNDENRSGQRCCIAAKSTVQGEQGTGILHKLTSHTMFKKRLSHRIKNRGATARLMPFNAYSSL